MAAPSPWANLSADEMSEIARRVPCEWDRAHMAFVCRSWRAGIAASPPPPPALPQLLLPSDDLTRVSCILSGCGIHRGYHDDVGVRYFGSGDGGYLFLAREQTRHHGLIDLLQPGGAHGHFLPDVVCPRYHPSVQHVHNMVIFAATLSSPPGDPGCVAAGIVTYQRYVDEPRQRRCAFWRMGDQVAYDVRPPNSNDAVVDVVFRGDGFFHFLTDEEHVLASAPVFMPGGDQPLREVGQSTTLRRCVPRDRSHDGFVRARYLLESRDELLMVVRFAPDPESPTSGFRVFSRIGPLPLEDDGSGGMVGQPYIWSELGTLGGRMLFVQRGCSRSFETADYPGFKEGIYFLDDRSFDDEDIMFRDLDDRQYPCNDNGKWTQGPPPNVERFFPEEGPSNHSSPAWILVEVRRPACLPPEILIEIARRVWCDAGRMRMVRACHLASGDLAAAALPQLPWLLRPFPDGPSLSYFTCGSGAESVIHNVRAPADSRGARFFGSYDGRWVFLADGKVHRLVNIVNGKAYFLPGRVSYPRNGRDDMTILTATLSSSPDKKGCVAAGIVHMAYLNKPIGIVLWEMGSQVGIDPFAPSGLKMCPDDVVFHNGSFHFITNTAEILIWTPDVSQGFLQLDNWSVFRLDYETDGTKPKLKQILAQYLVSSRGELLLILKYNVEKSYLSESFRVFHVTGLNETKPHFSQCLCTELKCLDGRMLFVGRGQSRCFEASDFPGSLGGIYFLDDSGDMLHQKAPYPCMKNGMWSSGPPPVIYKCFQPALLASNYSCPVWVLP